MNKLIYIKESDIPLTKHRKSFIKKIITEKGAVTYEDKECTIIQCNKKSAYRSISELHLIVKSRFKLTSLRTLVKTLTELSEEDKRIALVYCTQINKVVVKYVKNCPTNYGISNYSRNNFYDQKGVDGYSLRDYEELCK